MSTGHCSTQAPQVVHDHSTSGSITPCSCAVPTSGRAASASANALTFEWSAPASTYGALAYAWSRSDRTSSFGESGLAVFQAGHWDWHRPHSVQVVKSSRPFQVKSSTLATPNRSVSGSAFSKSSGLPPDIIGRSPPSAGADETDRLKKMLKNAANRCHATPIVRLTAMTTNQARLTRIFTSATTVIATALAGRTAPRACEIGAAQTGYGNCPLAALKPRIRKMQTTIATIVYST